MSDEKEATKEEVFKAIGHLDEATKTMQEEYERSFENDEQVVGFLTILGRVVRGIFERKF